MMEYSRVYYREDEYSEMDLKSKWIKFYCEATDAEVGSWRYNWLVSCAVHIEERLRYEFGNIAAGMNIKWDLEYKSPEDLTKT